MSNIDETLDYVNQQIAFYQTRLNDSSTKNPKFYQHHFDGMCLVKARLEQSNLEIQNPEKNISITDSRSHQDYISISANDIEGLPKELVEELNLTESDLVEFEIVNIIKQHGDVMSLDHLLIALYKQTNAIYKRKILTAKLYRMVNKGLVYNVPDKRGVYTTTQIEGQQICNEEDADLL